MIFAELFARFLVISLLAFGGGQAALPLLERVTVRDTGWLTPTAFGSAVAFGYLTPGPVLITATFVGYQVSGGLGALSATLGAFVTLATLTAQQVQRFSEARWLRRFGAGAAAAAIGLLGVTALSIGREELVTSPYVAIAVGVFVLACCARVPPVLLLAIGGILGWLAG